MLNYTNTCNYYFVLIVDFIQLRNNTPSQNFILKPFVLIKFNKKRNFRQCKED